MLANRGRSNSEYLFILNFPSLSTGDGGGIKIPTILDHSRPIEQTCTECLELILLGIIYRNIFMSIGIGLDAVVQQVPLVVERRQADLVEVSGI